jgi:hypothetical protein
MATETTKITYVEGAAAATPAASRVAVYAKTDGLMYSKDDAGAETLMSGGAGGGSVATDAIWDAAGDIAVGTGADTAARLAIGTTGQVLTSNGTTAAWAAAAGGSDWDSTIVKASDDTVTNSAVLTSDSELLWAVGATTDVWRFELLVLYDSTLAGDYKCNLVASAGTFSAAYRYLGSDTAANAVLVSTGIRISGGTALTDIAAGGTSGGTVRFILIEGVIIAPSQAFTMNFKFAQNTQTGSESAVTKIGSTLKLKQLR